MAKQLTIRGVPDEVAERLRRRARERDQSMNAAALELLASGLGVEPRRRRLERYATWTEAEAEEFDAALSQQRRLDDPAWG